MQRLAGIHLKSVVFDEVRLKDAIVALRKQILKVDPKLSFSFSCTEDTADNPVTIEMTNVDAWSAVHGLASAGNAGLIEDAGLLKFCDRWTARGFLTRSFSLGEASLKALKLNDVLKQEKANSIADVAKILESNGIGVPSDGYARLYVSEKKLVVRLEKTDLELVTALVHLANKGLTFTVKALETETK
ncbi:MAG TPA: hypothetical protein VG796_03530 [Verrucomicrobiales bacterium]|nr:hypothetical protein [Verrucomicrobiales bacterium]